MRNLSDNFSTFMLQKKFFILKANPIKNETGTKAILNACAPVPTENISILKTALYLFYGVYMPQKTQNFAIS